MAIATPFRSGSLPMKASSDPGHDVWCKGYVSLNQIPRILKTFNPAVQMSFQLVRQAVEDNALKVQVIGNQMRVTKDAYDAFVKVVEEGIYVPSSNPQKAHWHRPDTQ